MSSMIVNGRYPPVNGSTLNDVTSEERSSAIDFVNRHNFVFEEFDHAKMIDTFLPNATVYHSHDGGVIVRYQETLVRYGWPGDDTAGFTRKDVVRENGLPAIWWIGTNIDRLRMTSNGWKIYERYLGTPFRNGALDLDRAPEKVSAV
ncbi:uncharacterized protein BO87DRAFT_381866 [Aspergillus neoniger CBS 115656]|uniref:Uncharacterized protein n=1 Tax=Aspergillus neoniger (strain CBS 115656) TaxID=1448310 RepID=A0A318ZWC4_ASPNB|nr:hypothetical protein BO87DRAFT_381866 [Aspergillus neoniger CBS 115656]PYH39842.1 hypothetical protein BO87DRAFT_381866 [Aspergillus neoniger CBS 115656]